MSGISHHLARRAVEAVKDDFPQVEAWQWVVLGVTGALFFFSLATLEYVYDHVVATLVMVEEPEDSRRTVPAPKINVSFEDEEKEPFINPGLMLQPRFDPLSLSIFKLLGKLKDRSFRNASMRALLKFVAFNLAAQLIAGFLQNLVRIPELRIVFGTVSLMAVSRLALSWNHTVIADPLTRFGGRKLNDKIAWKRIVLATMLCALTDELRSYVIRAVTIHSSQPIAVNAEGIPEEIPTKQILLGFLPLVTMIAYFFFVQMPSRIAMTRVYASTLPEDIDTIVPVDRTFGLQAEREEASVESLREAIHNSEWRDFRKIVRLYGKMARAEIHASRNGNEDTTSISTREAFRSLTWPLYARLFKLYSRLIGLQILTTVVFVAIFIAETMIMFGGVDGIRDRVEVMMGIH